MVASISEAGGPRAVSTSRNRPADRAPIPGRELAAIGNTKRDLPERKRLITPPVPHRCPSRSAAYDSGPGPLDVGHCARARTGPTPWGDWSLIAKGPSAFRAYSRHLQFVLVSQRARNDSYKRSSASRAVLADAPHRWNLPGPSHVVRDRENSVGVAQCRRFLETRDVDVLFVVAALRGATRPRQRRTGGDRFIERGSCTSRRQLRKIGQRRARPHAVWVRAPGGDVTDQGVETFSVRRADIQRSCALQVLRCRCSHSRGAIRILERTAAARGEERGPGRVGALSDGHSLFTESAQQAAGPASRCPCSQVEPHRVTTQAHHAPPLQQGE